MSGERWAETLVGGCVPKPNPFVVVSGCDGAAVWTERYESALTIDGPTARRSHRAQQRGSRRYAPSRIGGIAVLRGRSNLLLTGSQWISPAACTSMI